MGVGLQRVCTLTKIFISVIWIVCLLPISHSVHDFLILVETWPPSYCMINRCSGPNINNRFTIHGVWDAYNNGQYGVGPCTSTNFSRPMVVNIERQLNMSWPNLKDQNNNEEIWSHEWEKHGTCLEPYFNIPTYFQLGLDLEHRYPVLNFLRRHGYNPGPGRMYNTTDIKNVIWSEVGSEPVLICLSRNRNRNRNANARNRTYPLLIEVRLCFDSRGARPIPTCMAGRHCQSPFVMLP